MVRASNGDPQETPGCIRRSAGDCGPFPVHQEDLKDLRCGHCLTLPSITGVGEKLEGVTSLFGRLRVGEFLRGVPLGWHCENFRWAGTGVRLYWMLEVGLALGWALDGYCCVVDT